VCDHLVTDYYEAVISSLGSRLLSLSILTNGSFNLDLLEPCSLLENLSIGNDDEEDFQVTSTSLPEVFLPRLTKLYTRSCLGLSSRLLEVPMSSLTKVDLYCCHIGNPEASDFDWDDVPVLWPNLQELNICCPSDSLTLYKLRRIVPQLTKLKHIILAEGTLQTEEERQSADIWIAELMQNSNIRLCFDTDFFKCCFIPEE
jgi:hypothetical protein